MLIKAILIGILATMCGNVFSEYLVWIFRNPLVEGTLVGLILGDVKTGAIIGGTIQLIYMGQITVGGISSFDKCYAGVMATAVTMLANQTPEVGVTLAVTLGTLGLLASNAIMTVNVIFVHMADKYVESGETKKIWVYNWLLPNLFCILVYGLPAFFIVMYGASAFESFMNAMPAFVSNALNTVGAVLPALGIGMMLKAVYKKRFVAFVIIGFVLCAYLHLDIIACTLIGLAAAMLYWSLGIDKLTEGDAA
ncbi:MAG: PTS sugar transporter subunit IIC [Stecheria intestinalis]|jgi:mannose/fructose/N-acetylgalactosamine-specific phosphotransferase system component IIC|nr:PTS sugar transporter subunit IIC [Stecheria intestinalis]